MRRFASAIFSASLFLAILTSIQNPALGQAAAMNPAGSRLPIRRVVLYKNGIGYFERSARVKGSEKLHIDFTTAQLNDVLMSLTVVDLNGGRITGMRFNSVAPLDERLRALHLPLGEETSRLRPRSWHPLRSSRVISPRGGRHALTPWWRCAMNSGAGDEFVIQYVALKRYRS